MITLKMNWEIPVSGVFSDVAVASQIGGIFASGDWGLHCRFIQPRDKCGQAFASEFPCRFWKVMLNDVQWKQFFKTFTIKTKSDILQSIIYSLPEFQGDFKTESFSLANCGLSLGTVSPSSAVANTEYPCLRCT